MSITRRTLRLPVWPFHALGLLAIGLGVLLIVLWWPGDYPDESELVKVSGEVAKIVVRDDLSGTSAGAMMQGWTSTYFTLEGVDGEFRYTRNHPKNLLVRDSTGVNLDLWVEPSAIGGDEAAIIWQIQEHNPYKQEQADVLPPETFVSHAEIVGRLEEIDRSMLQTGAILSLCGLILVLIGIGARRWNQRTAAH